MDKNPNKRLNKKSLLQYRDALTLLAWFQEHPHSTYMRAARDLEIPVVQVKDQLVKLTLSGVMNHGIIHNIDISIQDKDYPSFIELLGAGSPLALSPEEISVLMMNLISLRNALGENLLPASETLHTKLNALLAESRNRHDRRALGGSHTALPTSLQDAEEEEVASEKEELTAEEKPPASYTEIFDMAIKERRRVQVTYHSLSSDSKRKRVLCPELRGSIGGEFYIWAREVADEADKSTQGGTSQKSRIKTFALERFSGDITLDEPGSAGENAAIGDMEFDLHGDPVTLHLQPDALWMLEYYPMDDTDSPRYPDHSLDVSMPDTGEWLEKFILKFSRSVSVVKPLSLSDRIRDRARQGLSAYEQRA